MMTRNQNTHKADRMNHCSRLTKEPRDQRYSTEGKEHQDFEQFSVLFRPGRRGVSISMAYRFYSEAHRLTARTSRFVLCSHHTQTCFDLILKFQVCPEVFPPLFVPLRPGSLRGTELAPALPNESPPGYPLLSSTISIPLDPAMVTKKDRHFLDAMSGVSGESNADPAN